MIINNIILVIILNTQEILVLTVTSLFEYYITWRIQTTPLIIILISHVLKWYKPPNILVIQTIAFIWAQVCPESYLLENVEVRDNTITPGSILFPLALYWVTVTVCRKHKNWQYNKHSVYKPWFLFENHQPKSA